MTTTTTTMQQRRDTLANWTSVNPTPKAGEICFETDTGKMKIGNGSTAYLSLPYKADNDVYQINDKLYDGVNLTTKFATEISSYSDVWTWIKTRISNNNFDGINIGDYIPVSLSAGTISDGTTTYTITAKTLNAQIAGIDTYYGYGDVAVGHHIDFITKETIGTNIKWNPNDNNNGTSTAQYPWLSSQIYACLNGVNNESTSAYNSVKHGFNASSGGVLQLLPSALQNKIVTKRLYMPKRYSASGLLTSSPDGGWDNAGKLWLPTEFELYGSPIHSADKATDNSGLDFNNIGTPVQYPLFAGSNSYRNYRNKNRARWWLSSVPSGSSARACNVYSYGDAAAYGCANTYISAPVCFRIA